MFNISIIKLFDLFDLPLSGLTIPRWASFFNRAAGKGILLFTEFIFADAEK